MDLRHMVVFLHYFSQIIICGGVNRLRRLGFAILLQKQGQCLVMEDRSRMSHFYLW
jgi:hypothetical protein